MELNEETQKQIIFNRRIRLWTTIGIWVLLFIMLFAGWQQFSFRERVGTNYCYACGYYEGKTCSPFYFDDYIIRNATLLEQNLKILAENNAKIYPTSYDDLKSYEGRIPLNFTNERVMGGE